MPQSYCCNDWTSEETDSPAATASIVSPTSTNFQGLVTCTSSIGAICPPVAATFPDTQLPFKVKAVVAFSLFSATPPPNRDTVRSIKLYPALNSSSPLGPNNLPP